MCWMLVNDLNLKKGEKKEVVLCSFVVVDIYNIHVHVCELKIEKIYFFIFFSSSLFFFF